MNASLDLTAKSATFRELPADHLVRPDYIRWLAERFSRQRQVILLSGPEGSGKTTLLAEFAKTYSTHSFSYFIYADHWGMSTRRFLIDLIHQMHSVVEDHPLPNLEAFSDIKLQAMFESQYRRVGVKARAENQPYYFVVDGLDWVKQDLSQQTIIDLLPVDLLPNIYLLVSSSNEQKLSFTHSREKIMPFTPNDTMAYLAELEMDRTHIQEIHRLCSGLPGYLAEIKRQVQAGIEFEAPLTNLPGEYKQLLKREWDRTSLEEHDEEVVALLAYSEIRFSPSYLAEMLHWTKEQIFDFFRRVPFLEYEQKFDSIRFITDAHHKYAIERLTAYHLHSLQVLVDHFRQEPYNEQALQELPKLYYRQPDGYESLKDLVSTEYLTEILDRENAELSLVRRDVQFIADQALEHKDWHTLSKFSVIGSTITTLSTGAIAEAEIDALLSLEDYQRALDIAMNSVLKEDRLHNLAKCAKYLQKKGIPVSPELEETICQLAESISPTGVSLTRAIEIAADLFHIRPQTAMDLVERIAGVEGHGRTMDEILAALSLILTEEEEFSTNIGDQIRDKGFHDFVQANSQITARLTAEQVLLSAGEIVDVSGQLYMLRSWCNSNRTNPDAIRVIQEATKVMTNSELYTPSMRHLRQFAEPLLACEYSAEVEQLVFELNILANSAIREPIEEWVRLNLILATVEAGFSLERADNRLYQVYFEIEGLDENSIDTYCYSLVRILLSLPNISTSLLSEEEIERELRDGLHLLLKHSAEHWVLTRRLIRALSDFNRQLAEEIVGNLNVRDRRDVGYLEILRTYIDSSDYPDFTHSFELAHKLSEPTRQDFALTYMLDEFAEKDTVPSDQVRLLSQSVMARIAKMRAAHNRCFAYAFWALLLNKNTQYSLAEQSLDLLLESWNVIATEWDKTTIGYMLVTILADSFPEFSRQLLADTNQLKQKSPLTNDQFANLYTHTIRLAIRTLRDVLKSEDGIDVSRPILNAIRTVSSPQSQVELLADLALAFNYCGKNERFTEMLQHILETLDTLAEEERAQAVIYAAPALFLHERNLLNHEMINLSSSERDAALSRVFSRILTVGALDEPVTVKNVACNDVGIALKACEVISHMEHDAAIYSFVDTLVSALIARGRDGEERSLLNERQTLRIAKELIDIIEAKLPDPKNIQHQGYKIAAQACLARLHASIPYPKAYSDWNKLIPSWKEVTDEAHKIPNTADRALVMGWIGAKVYPGNNELGRKLLEESQEFIYQIPNALDRSQRFYSLAESWQSINEHEAAKLYLEEAMKLIEYQTWAPSRDTLAGRVLNLAHSISPDFATALTSSIDNPLIRENLKRKSVIEHLKSRPDKLTDQPKSEDLLAMLGQVATELLQSLRQRDGIVHPQETVGQWLHCAMNAHFADTYKVVSWAIDNQLAATIQSTSTLKPTYYNLLETVRLVYRIGQIVFRDDTPGYVLGGSTGFLEGIEFFSPDQKGSAEQYIKQWLKKRTQHYVKIYDPYFSKNELHFLQTIPAQSRVFIVTSQKGQTNLPQKIEDIVVEYQRTWSSRFKQPPPNTQIYIVGVPHGGDSVIHDRYIITNGSGLHLSTSLSGLDSKDITIRALTTEEALAIEERFINPWLLGTIRFYKGEAMNIMTFIL